MLEASFQLNEKYETYLKENRLDLYIKDLSEEALNWWFEMDTPSILVHLEPLKNLPVSIDLPPRIMFLREASKQLIPYDQMEEFYRIFNESGDLEAEAAAIGAAVAANMGQWKAVQPIQEVEKEDRGPFRKRGAPSFPSCPCLFDG
ncbi:MAG: hypothetical protein D6778_09565, partial [Nitrospirae bacterium]